MKDNLHMYLTRTTPVGGEPFRWNSMGLDSPRLVALTFEEGYWRNAWPIHRWITANLGTGSVRIHRGTLENLVDSCFKTLECGGHPAPYDSEDHKCYGDVGILFPESELSWDPECWDHLRNFGNIAQRVLLEWDEESAYTYTFDIKRTS